MSGAELNRLREKAELLLDKANQLIILIEMVETRKSVVRKYSSFISQKHIDKHNHMINTKEVIIESLKKELKWMM